MNDSEAACFGAEALEYHCSVCDFVRLAVRPVNSDFDIFIRILFYLNNKWREDARKLSRPQHGLVHTKKTTGSSETWSIFFFFFFGGGGGGVPFEPKRQWLGLFAGIVCFNLCPILKTNTPLQSPFHLLNENGLLARIQREMTPWRSFEISRHFAANHAERNDSD